jgi:hypothetical protein
VVKKNMSSQTLQRPVSLPSGLFSSTQDTYEINQKVVLGHFGSKKTENMH